MATVTFSAAGETLYAYLAGEIDHDAAQSLRMQLDDALVSRSPRTLIIDLGGVGFMGFLRHRAHPWAAALRPRSGHDPAVAARPRTAAKSPAAGGNPLYGEYRKGECAMKAENSTRVQFDSLSSNEAYARGVTAAFLARYDPTVPQLADLKTAVSEAVTNCIVHAYPEHIGPVCMTIAVYPDREVHITITDKGIGIPNVEQAMQPLFTTGNPEERSGLGFAVMQSFMDRVKVTSKPGKGTRVLLVKRLSRREPT